jgi:serpin B
MELTRRDGLRLLAMMSTVLAAPTVLAGCGAGSGQRKGGPVGELELASSDLARSPGLVDAIPGAVASVAALAGGLYGALAEQPGNLALSPYSVAVALAMALNGAEGDTAAEMRDVLRVADLDRFNGGLDALTRYVEGLAGKVKRADGSDAELALDTANALFGQRDTGWKKPFLDALATDYGAGIRLVDYKAATEAARTLINDWTATRTHDRIPEILARGVVDAMTRLVLVNAIYLKAPWEEPFSKMMTAKRQFTTADGTSVQADTMTLGMSSSGYASGESWEAVRLLYAGRQTAMTIVLPAEGRLEEVSTFVAGGGLADMLAANEPVLVQLSLPRWTFRTQAELTPVLTALGMPTAFDARAADFGQMTADERLFISAVVHEAFIAVDEEGTEAAAATAVVVSETSLPRYQKVVVDRPFLFVIHDVEHGTPLFLGRVSDPTA